MFVLVAISRQLLPLMLHKPSSRIDSNTYLRKHISYSLQVKFVMSEETNLSDLLALNLHKFEDEVRNIVDKATKELSMEKTMKELDVTWAQMEFESEPHPRTGVMLLKSSEELIETLEDNQVSWMRK